MADDQYIEFRDKAWACVDEIFPHVGSKDSSMAGNSYSIGHLTNTNKSWKGTQYYHMDKAELIHFTSVKSLFSILSEKTIRMYCLNNSNDPNEYLFAKDLLKIREEIFNNIKDNYFSLSTCLPSEINNQKLWTKYGSNNTGVAIKFCFENYDNWRNYYLAKVDYNGRHPFKNLLDLRDDVITSKRANVNLFDFLGDFLCFHKWPKWQHEEHRLLYNGNNEKEYEQGENATVFSDVKKDFSIVKYHTLPLKVEIKYDKGMSKFIFENEDSLLRKPHIKILSVTLGKAIPIENRSIIANRIKSISLLKLGYRVEVE